MGDEICNFNLISIFVEEIFGKFIKISKSFQNCVWSLTLKIKMLKIYIFKKGKVSDFTR